mgnify:CR=1 FL=1
MRCLGTHHICRNGWNGDNGYCRTRTCSTSLGTSAVSEDVSSVAVSSVPQSNSQNDVVVLNAPAKMSAALPVGLLLSSRKRMDSESISPNVRSEYATMGFLVSDAGERWKTCASLGLVMSLISYKKPTEFFSDTYTECQTKRHRSSDNIHMSGRFNTFPHSMQNLP